MNSTAGNMIRILFTLSVVGGLHFSQLDAAETAPVCIQVIQPAIDPSTGACKDFPTPCDVPSGWKTVNSCEDTQLEDIEKEKELKNAKELQTNFKLQKFASCQNMEDVMSTFIQQYYKANPYGVGGGPIMMEDDMVRDNPVPTTGAPESADKRSAEDFSETNIQVAWVDESEIVKTDGKHVYYYNSADRKIYIANAFPATELNILKKINVPASFSNPELFLHGKKLTIISSKYSDYAYGGRYWYNRSAKTVVVVYDISNLASLKLEKYYQVDGNLSQSRKIGKYAYLLSTANFSFPYPMYFDTIKPGASAELNSRKLDADFSPAKILPKKIELRTATSASDRNFVRNGKTLPYNLTSKDAATCNEVEYVLPDASTMEQFQFAPSFAILSIVDLENPTASVKTKVLFGDVSEIHMSLDNLYIASHLYTNYAFKCPMNARCIMPAYHQGQNTLLHKINIRENNASYQASTVIPGSPLNQYSMDQDASGRFRIITSKFYPERNTNLFILNNDLSLEGSLEGIEEGEDFKSSRFIGNRLYLVTFEQIDPLFTIDLTDSKKPKILGELKIPGYSTYLHPYDENHLIGIGYDTKQNQWGGVQNAGVKVDLYDISDFNNPKQKYTYTMGDQWSYSEVLSNPRQFVWYAKKNTLFMPVTLYTNAWLSSEPYRNKDAWQGTVALKIDANSGINETVRITHLDFSDLQEKRKKDCEQYTKPETPVCRPLIGWGQYCGGSSSSYVPPYCYADSPIGEYLASNIWNYQKQFIQRNLYLDNALYTISNTKIQANDIDDGYRSIKSVNFQ